MMMLLMTAKVRGVWTDVLMVGNLVDAKVETWGVWKDTKLDASMVECLAVSAMYKLPSPSKANPTGPCN